MLHAVTPAVERAWIGSTLGPSPRGGRHRASSFASRPSGRRGRKGSNSPGRRRARAGQGAAGSYSQCIFDTRPADGRTVAATRGQRAFLDAARLLAAEISGDRTVSSDALLLSVLREDEPLRQYLVELGLEFARLEESIQAQEGPPLRLDEPLFQEVATDDIATERILDASANRAARGVARLRRLLPIRARRHVSQPRAQGGAARTDRRPPRSLSALAAQPGGSRYARRRRYQHLDCTSRSANRRSTSCWPTSSGFRSPCAVWRNSARSAMRGLARSLEALRYRSYTLEKALVLSSTSRRRLAGAHLYVLLSSEGCVAALDWTIEEAAAGGAAVFHCAKSG